MTIHSGAKIVSGTEPRTGLRGRVGRHPLIWFFSLSFLPSWLAWLPYVLSDDGLGIPHFGFPVISGTTQLLGVLPATRARLGYRPANHAPAPQTSTN